MRSPIYLDNQATTPTDPKVLEAMQPYFCEIFGNPSSSHCFGLRAKEAIEKARQQVADCIGASAQEIIFTSGATESNNHAIFGITRCESLVGKHIITSATEHYAVLDPIEKLEERGFRVTRLKVDASGIININDVEAALEEDTVLISIMFANNEIGTINPIAEIGKLAKAKGICFHCDAAQAVGKVPIDVKALGIDLLSLTAHKLYGPKGIGALYINKSGPADKLGCMFYGGGQERRLRSGTQNVPGIVGLGICCQIACENMADENQRLRDLRERLLDRLTKQLDGVKVNGDLERRLAGNLNLCFSGVDAGMLRFSFPEIAISSGSACSSSGSLPSHVLSAIGLQPEEINSSVRLAIGRFNSEEEIDYVASTLVSKIQELKANQ